MTTSQSTTNSNNAAGNNGTTGFSYAAVIRSHAAERPDAPAISFGNGTLTFGQLHHRSTLAANALLAAGVGRGSRVAVLSKNHPVFFELAFACSKIGAVLVGLNWRLAAAEIEAIVADADPSVVIVADEQRPLLGPGTIATLTAATAMVVSLETEYESWIGSASAADPMVPTDPSDTILLLYTSGTTGVPKGVELTNHNVSFTGRLANEVWGFTEISVNLVGMPMFHIGGIGYGMGAVLVGGHTVLIRDNDAATIISSIQRHRVTHGFFVPAVIQTIISAPDVESADLSSLELVVYGAAPIGDAVLRRAISVLRCSFMQNYGMTETAGTVVALPSSDHNPDDPTRSALLRSCGRAVSWVELGLFDPSTGTQVPTGSVGEIWVRTEMSMKGYRNKPDETSRTITPEGWLRTGDAAYADAQGYVFLFDRFKDMIVSGAENIYPAEIENVLYDHPEIAEVAVIGVPSERWGETPRAIVVLRPGASLDADAVIEFARNAPRSLQVPVVGRVRGCAPAERVGEDTQEGSSGALLGRPRPGHLMSVSSHPFVALMRRYVIDYLLCQDATVCAQIMEPDYILHMGGTELGPRDDVYVPAVVRQLEQFPGLGMTVHEIAFTEDRLAMRFSQHGASARHNGRMASWGGIGLYRWNGTKLTSNYAIEDYYSRKRQLGDGIAEPVERPAIAPWDTPIGTANPLAEADVRSWLNAGAALQPGDRLLVDDHPLGTAAPLLDVESTIIDELFSVGARVAFHVTQHGRYCGGVDAPAACIGQPVTLYSVGVVSRSNDGRLEGRIIRERAALQRSLKSPA